MLTQAVDIILTKGGLGYALFLAAVSYWARDRARLEAVIADRDVTIGRLHGDRVAATQKEKDDTLAVNARLVEVLTLNKDTLDDVRTLLEGHDAKRRAPR